MAEPTSGFKVLVVGDTNVGKTSFLRRYVQGRFETDYKSTIGVDFLTKFVDWKGRKAIPLQFWDIAGQERYGNMTRVYFKQAVGAVIVYDKTRTETFQAVKKWKEDIDSKVTLSNGKPIPVVLMANKCDLETEATMQNVAEIEALVKELNFVGWLNTSVKNNVNIEAVANRLMEIMIANEDECIREAAATATAQPPAGTVTLIGPAPNKPECSC